METSTLSAVAGVLLLAIVAPIIPGIASRTKALVAGRRGAPVWQLYADLWKLARRGAVYSATTTWLFRIAPTVVVGATLGAVALVPLTGGRAPIQLAGDAVAFAYLLALGRFALVLAALDTGSSFEGLGASRDVTFAALIEPGLFVALACLGVASRSFSLSTMLGMRGAPAAAPASLLIAASLFALTLAECSRVPVDDPATHLELTMVHEVMVLDHSGPDLAMILYAAALKLAVLAAIIGRVLWPVGADRAWAAAGVMLASCVATGLAVGLVESSMARLRLPRVPLYITAGGAMATFGLILLIR